MTNMMLRLAAPIVLAVSLAGCSSDQDVSAIASSAQVLGSLKQAVAGRRAGPAPKIQLTSDQVANLNQPVLQVNPETFGGSDFLGRSVSRRDSGIGLVEVWKSSDSAQIFLRNGVVVGTRGVGGDMISADANFTIRALNGSAQTSGLKTFIISDGDVTTTEYHFNCTISDLGVDNINISNQSYRTNRVREDCIGGPDGTAALRNEYWVQSSSNLVRKSRQWIGPRVGYFEILLVKN